MGTIPPAAQFPLDDRNAPERALSTARGDEQHNPAAPPNVLTQQDERELAIIREQLATITGRIARLERNPHGDGLREYFPALH